MNEADLLERLRRDLTPCGVAAAFRGECSLRGLDGARWKVLITDGLSFQMIEVQLHGSDGGIVGMDVDPAAVEAATERMAATFPALARAACMAAASEHHGPLSLHRGDLPA